jgi:hypothetical protein
MLSSSVYVEAYFGAAVSYVCEIFIIFKYLLASL